MTRYPHTTPWKPAIGFAAIASVATLAIAVVLPAVSSAPCAEPASLATQDGRNAQATVRLERLDAPVGQSTAAVSPSAERG